jgi:tyrosyl-tRNA synthetase
VTGLLVDLGWYPSRSAARRVVEQNGVRVNGQKIGLDHVLRDGDVLQAGRRNIVRVRVG